MGMTKKEIVFTLDAVKKHSIRYESVTMANPRDFHEHLTTAQFYIPNWILDHKQPKAIRITIEEVSE